MFNLSPRACLKGIARIWILSICTFLISNLLTGCSSEKQTSPAKPTITIWHWMTDRQPAFQELAKRYEEKFAVKVNFELYAPSDAYSQKVRAAAQGVSLPDVFGILGEMRDFASFVKAGHILDLSPYMEAEDGAWKQMFFPQALSVNEFKPNNFYGVTAGIYGVPLDIMTIQMLYNKDLFQKMGLSVPPATFGEFLALGKKLKANNLQGLVSGWGEMWMIECLANNYAFSIMGKDKVLSTIKGEVAYTDPDWIKVLDLFRQMRESGVLATGIVTMVNKTAEQLFANAKAVFAFNGSWCVNVYKGMNPNLKFAVMLAPKVSNKYPMTIWGGAGSSLMVNAHSPQREEAVKFLGWLTDNDQQVYLAVTTNNLPANKNSVGNIPEVLSQFARNMDNTTHPNLWGISEFPAVIEAMDKGIQSIIIEEKTPGQVAAEVQKVKERELARKR